VDEKSAKDADCSSGQKCGTNNTYAEPTQVNQSRSLFWSIRLVRWPVFVD
jgi:hypothetical protein